MKIRNERGEGKLKFAAITVFVVLVVILAFRIVPVFVKSFDLKDFIRNQAKFHRVNQLPNEEVVTKVLRKTTELGLPVERNQIKVVSSGAGAGVNVDITVNYSVTMDLFVYQWTYTWEIQADTKSAF